jgi:acyl-CoA dehydrogenase
MSWDFETEPGFAAQLDWIEAFVRDEVLPLDHVVEDPYDVKDPVRAALIPPLQDRVRAQGLWACHLSPKLGGQGYGQVKLALINEILGRSRSAPVVFGCQAPDSGNSEILAHFGTAQQQRRWLDALLAGEIVSCFAMTEPQGGADPKVFTTSAVQDGGAWIIRGEKWYASNASVAAFFLVLAVTEPDASPYHRLSMFIVPAEVPGLEIVRRIRSGTERYGAHGYVRFNDVRVPADHLLGERGGAFAIAQTRLGGGRIHHAMRTVGLARRALDMMGERAVSRHTQGGPLATKQLVQQAVAESWIQLESFRLLVLQTAWKIDRYQDYQRVRADISAVKAMMPRVLHDIAACALQVHGSLGASQEMPFLDYIAEAFHMGLVDGPTEVHLLTLGRELLKGYEPAPGLFPTGHLPALRAAAEARLAAPLGAARLTSAPGRAHNGGGPTGV